MKSKKTICVVNAIALAITLVVNYLSNTGIFNGNTMKSVSDQYHNLFTPAGYAFSIWGLIYLFLIGFVIYSFVILKREKESRIIAQVGSLFLMTCVLNCLWILAWLYGFTAISVLLMIALLVTLLKIVLRTKMELTNPPFRIVALVWWPFSLYSGWISVALIANIAAYLTKIGWNGFGISDTIWTIIMILIAGIIYMFMTWKRNMREFALVGVWALIAVAVANLENSEIIYWVAVITAISIAVSSMVHGIKNFRGFGKTIEEHEGTL